VTTKFVAPVFGDVGGDHTGNPTGGMPEGSGRSKRKRDASVRSAPQSCDWASEHVDRSGVQSTRFATERIGTPGRK